MKGILEFNLDEPFERNAFIRATHATDAYLVLHDLMEDILRRRLRYDSTLTDDHAKLLESVRGEIVDAMECRGVNLDDLE